MTLTPGQQLSFYEILGSLGAGGMGEVFRARDTRLGREVAIKVLPAAFVEDDERLRRFEREARLLASLNHPNVAAIYGIDQIGDTCFLTLELVPGENLAERLQRGRLSISDAVDVCRQIAEGVEAAHEAGIVHRDLKPANVHLTPDGIVKVLDFGLAKASTGDPVLGSGSGSTTARPDSVLATEEGLILGTPTYMSPEQARGRPVDRRADVWAFGCVLFECLSGKRAFDGESFSEIAAAILEHEPDWSALPAGTPARLVELVRSCVEKEPRRRLRDVGDARLALERIARGEDGSGASAASATSPAKLLLGTALGLLVGVAAMALWSRAPEVAVDAPLVVASRLEAPEGAKFQLFGDFGGAPAFSPDGTKLAFVCVSADGLNRIWVRALNDLRGRELSGTEGAYLPFWSPDGRSLGYFANDELRRIDLDGGAPLKLAVVAQGKGGTWGPDGTLVFAPNFGSELYAVSASGGKVRPVTEKAESHTTHRWPQFLPDGRSFLFFAASHDDLSSRERGVYLGSLDGGPIRFLLPNDTNAVHAAEQLLFVREGVLLAQSFDAERGELVGASRVLLEDVLIDSSTWRSNVGASSRGLAYQSRGEVVQGRLQWIDRAGAELGSIASQGSHLCMNLSPSGRFVAVETQVSPNSDIWIHDLEAGTSNKLTLDAADEGRPAWSPDEKLIAFQSNRGDGTYRLYAKPSDGSRSEELLFEQSPREGEGKPDIWPDDWSPDGRLLLVIEGTYGEYDRVRSMGVVDLEGQKRVVPLVGSEGAITGKFSPDGRWLAFSAVNGGIEQVYVAPFDPEAVEAADGSQPILEGVPRWQVSYAGGSRPRWRGDGLELYYIRTDNTVVAVALEALGDSLRIGASTSLFVAPIRFRDYSYDVSADGQRFLLNTQGAGTKTPLVLVTGWRGEG